MTSTTADPRETAPSQASIVTHPWFPKVIGLWFAALFGLCSLALAPGMLEAVVTTLGIDRIVPAAAPPLGQTARLLLAMGMAGVGEIVGLLVGARLAAGRRPQAVRQRKVTSEVVSGAQPHVRSRDRHADAPPRKPLSAIDELGGIDNALRRRALASEADHEPRPFFQVAPLPGEDLAIAASEIEAPAITPPPAQPGAEQALDLALYDAPPEEPAMSETAPFAAPFSAPAEPVSAPVAATETEVLPNPVPFAAPAAAPAVQVASASLESLGVVQLSERLALALQARRERLAQQAAAVAVAAPAVVAPEPEAIDCVDEPPHRLVEPETEAPVATSFATPVEFSPSPAPMPRLPGLHASFAEAHDEDNDESHDIPALARSLVMPAPAARIPEQPAQDPRDVPPELERGLEILARRAPKPMPDDIRSEAADATPDTVTHEALACAPAEGEDPEEIADETAQADGYSSLLAMGSGGSRAEAVRIEEPESDTIEPVVIFPGQGMRQGQAPAPFAAPFGRPAAASEASAAAAPTALAGSAPQADPEETERALRAALASLQRISGAR